jgi:hypothetical protein
MKELSYRKNGEIHTPISYWNLNNIVLAMYQGNRGANPSLDFVLRYKENNKRLRTPSHTHWIVDLLIKSEFNKIKVKEFINDWILKYDELEPFANTNERDTYSLKHQNYFTNLYSEELDNHGNYKVDFLSTLIELFIICEKQTPNAFMFKDLLGLVKSYCEGNKDFYQVVSLSKRV